MTDQRVVKWGMITFLDGTTINLPPIGGSSNGWVYKPDLLRTRQEIASGKNRSWKRGTGWGPASDWLKEYFERQIVNRNWEVPIAVEKQIEDPSGTGAGDSLAVSWWNEPWGWTTLMIQRPTDSYGRRKPLPDQMDKLTYSLTIHELGMMYMRAQIIDVHGSYATANTASLRTTNEVLVADMRRTVLAWIADPVKETLRSLKEEHPIQRFDKVLQPPDLGKLSYMPGESLSQVTDDSVVTTSHGMLRLHQKGEIKRVMEDDVAWDALTGILDAFRYLGFDLRIDSGFVYGSGGSNQVKSLSIEILPSSDRNELGHSIMLDAEHGDISVSCGYANDEKLWIDRQSRVAAIQMDQLEEDLWTESTITLERKEE